MQSKDDANQSYWQIIKEGGKQHSALIAKCMRRKIKKVINIRLFKIYSKRVYILVFMKFRITLAI